MIWRSAKTLFERGAITTPGGVRELVESVYGFDTDDLDDVPVPLQQASRQAMGIDGAARSFANANLLKVRDGYGGQPQLWTPDTITPTRLGDPVTVFRLGKIEGGVVAPYYADKSPARAWALSEVSLSRRRATGVPAVGGTRKSQIEAAKTTWSKWDQDMPLLVLEADGDGWTGVVEKDGSPSTARYSPNVGLILKA